MWQCHYCRSQLPLDILTKNRMCPTCGSDLTACRNCTHFNEELTSKCNEPESPWIADRTSHNNCPYFEMKNVKHSAPDSAAAERLSEVERAKEAFRALFRNA